MAEFMKNFIIKETAEMKQCLDDICAKNEKIENPTMNFYCAKEKIKANGEEHTIRYIFSAPGKCLQILDMAKNAISDPQKIFDQMADFEKYVKNFVCAHE